MPAIAVNPPFPLFTDADGAPLDDAYIYIGTANQNPVSNPITVYWDSALTITATQPIRTSGGYPVYNGSPARFYTNSDYSILLRDKNGAFIYTAASETDFISSAFVTFIQSGTGAVATTVQAKLRETVSVKDFGAVGDGVTDDSAAFASAIAASDDVEVPDGSYVLSSVSGKSNLRLIGKGLAKLIHKASAAVNGHMLKFRDCNNWLVQGLEIDGNKANQTNSVHTVYVENNSQNWLINECYIHDAKIFGVMVAEDSLKPANWTIQNTRADSCGDSGVSTNGAYRGRFYGCSAQSNASQGFAFQGVSSYISATDCLAVSNGANGFFYGSANNCTTTNCYSKSNGATVGGSGFGFNTSTAGTCYKNTLVACIAESNSDDGVDINNAAGAENSDHKIIGCRFDSNNSGINCINSNNNFFQGNTVVASRLNGIHVQTSDRNVIAGNRLLNNGTNVANTYHGIYVGSASDYNVVEANVSTNDGGAANQRYGLYIDTGAVGTVVFGNDTSGNATGTINNDGTSSRFALNRSFANPSFRANKNAAQSIPNNLATKVTWQTELFDTQNTLTSNTWTPKFIGKYQVFSQITFTAAVDQKQFYIELQKNGSSHALQQAYSSGTGAVCVQISVIVDVTSASDYFEIFAYQNTGGAVDITNDSPQVFFCAALIVD